MTRPTGARVREALFSILGDLQDLDVLDLYAGSGALGIEALSRGAAHATFVENNRQAAACIRDNLALLGIEDRSAVAQLEVERAASSREVSAHRYHLLFCDPPWAIVGKALSNVERLRPLLHADARVVIEHPAKQELTLAGFVRRDERVWGDTGMSIFLLESSNSTDRSADNV